MVRAALIGRIPVFGLGGSIPLTSILEPVADLRGGESGGLGQFPFLSRRRIRIVRVPLAQDAPGLLLETIAGLLAVPDCPGQRELASDAILADGAQRSSSQFLGLDVVRLQPESLQLGVVLSRELVLLQDVVQFLEVASMEGDHRLRLEHALVLVQVFAGGQRPQEPAQPFYVARLQEHLAHAGHLFLRETERRQHGRRCCRHRRR